MKSLVNILSIVISLFVTSLFSASASAVIIEGSYRGVIDVLNVSADPSMTPVWENVSLGDEVLGSFWYDTDKAPTNLPSNNDLYYYTSGDVWLSSSFTIGGKKILLVGLRSIQRKLIH